MPARSTIIRAQPRGQRPPEPIPPTHPINNSALAALLGFSPSMNHEYVSEATVSGVPALQAGIDMVSHGVATMMTDGQAFKPELDEADAVIEDTPHVVKRPTVIMGSYEFWTQATDTLMKRGNYLAVKADYDFQGYPRQVVPVHPDSVTIEYETGIPHYRIHDQEYQWDEIIHIRHGAVVGSLWGTGIVERYRYALQRLGYEQEYAKSSFATGGVPSAVVQLDKPEVSSTEAEAVQDRWVERHGSGMRKPAVISKAMNITPLSWSPEDAEFMAARQFSVAEAALMCGLRPEDLGASIGGSGLTYANRQDDALQRIIQSFTPWMALLEQAWSDMLPSGCYMRGNPEALLRASTKERYEIYSLGHALGAFTTPEIRDLERRPTVDNEELPPEQPDTPEEEDEDDNDG